ncbi:hypothetical protein [Kitasatospora camelliae]|uniref:Uncharacterized protein n=1 Tax=Kitasatospora camelliae TaxID=3156397 RepID=A0AAU8K688_9ACTN
MNSHELNAICDVCKNPIADGAGNVWIDKADLSRAERGVKEWEDAQREAARERDGVVMYSADDLLAYPEAARWAVTHRACDPEPDTSAYSFEVHRCRTWAELVDWTAHLMGKTWLQVTDWNVLLEEATAARGHRISPSVKPKIR